MSPPGLRTALALVVLAMVVAGAGCGAHPGPPGTPAPPGTSPSPAQSTDSGRGSAEAGDANASDAAPPPDQVGNPGCADYDSWRPGPDGAGITVTYWYEGTEPVTVLVRRQGALDLSQTVDNDVQQRYHDFEFIDADPTTVTEILITTGNTSCYVPTTPPS